MAAIKLISWLALCHFRNYTTFRYMGCRGPVEMLGGQGLVLGFGFLALIIGGCHAPPSSTYDTNPPVYVWPLGDNITGLELNTHVRECDSNNLDYDTGSGTPLDYKAMKFVREDNSYIDIPILHTTDLDEDITFTFHLYPEKDGTFFHYKSDNSSEVGIAEMEIKVNLGAFETSMTFHNGSKSTRTTSLGLTNGTWYRIVVERDVSGQRVKYVETSTTGQSSIQTDFELWLKHAKTIFPGKLRLGGSHDGGSFFTGRLACMQVVNTKDPQFAHEYDGECAQNNWPTTSTIATTVTVSATGGTVTTSTSSSTTTITSTTTTSTPPDTTSTTTTSTTTPTTPTTATLTSTMAATTSTPPDTTSTTTTSTASATSTTTMPTTTTMAILQTSNTAPTKTTTKLPEQVPSVLHDAVTAITTGRNHFAATQNATYQFAGDILRTIMVDLRACAWLCLRDGDCGSFVYSGGGMCQIGVTSPGLASDVDKTMYTLQ